MTGFVLIGTGGHARVVYDALVASGANAGLTDVRSNIEAAPFYGHQVRTPEVLPDMSGTTVHVAIGDNRIRAKLLDQAQQAGAGLLTVTHPKACVSESAKIAPGCLVAAGAIVGPEAIVSNGSIVNHAAVVDHDCSIGAYCHIAPGVVLGGGVRLADFVLVGSNSTILPGKTVGAHAIIGAGAVVTKDVPAHAVWIGTGLRSE